MGRTELAVISFPGHLGPAPRAFALDAGNAACRWFPKTTLQADTGAGGSYTRTAPHTAGPLYVSALIMLIYLSRSYPFVHKPLLPAELPLKGPTSTAAARHCESLRIKGTCEPGMDDLVQIPGHKWNDLDPVSDDHFVQNPGNRAADQRADAQLREAKGFLDRKVIREEFLCLADNPSGLSFDKADLMRHIKNRRDSILPGSERRFHRPMSRSMSRIEQCIYHARIALLDIIHSISSPSIGYRLRQPEGISLYSSSCATVSSYLGAGVLLSSRGAAVPGGNGDAEFSDPAEQCGLMDAQLPGCGHAAVVIPLQGGADGLCVEQFVRSPNIARGGVGGPVPRQFLGEARDVDVALVAQNEGALDDVL